MTESRYGSGNVARTRVHVLLEYPVTVCYDITINDTFYFCCIVYTVTGVMQFLKGQSAHSFFVENGIK